MCVTWRRDCHGRSCVRVCVCVCVCVHRYNIMRVLGVQMAKMTPSRGYSAEMGTTLTIAIATIYGLPVSTTQCIVSFEPTLCVCVCVRV